MYSGRIASNHELTAKYTAIKNLQINATFLAWKLMANKTSTPPVNVHVFPQCDVCIEIAM
jgi:hypothetical protein